MTEIFLFANGMALGVLLLLSVKLWLQARQFIAGRLLLLVFIGLSGYLIAPFLDATPWLQYPVVVLAISVPGLFWLFAEALFNDWERRELSVGHFQVLVLLSFVIVAFLSFWLGAAVPSSAPGSMTNSEPGLDITLARISFYLAYLFRVVFMLLAFIAIVGQWRQDLVEPRRRLRSVIVVLGGTQIFLVIIVEIVLGRQEAPPILMLANSLILLVQILAIGFWLLILRPDSLPVLLGISHGSNALSTDAAEVLEIEDRAKTELNPQRLKVVEQDWLASLNKYMHKDSGYRNSELTIRVLSDAISIPEHRLRRLINQHLGFRNFNEYVNQFRISEAAACLVDPAQEHLPILTIAMEVGYASLTPFNRAFKAAYKQTPSAYRKLHMELKH
ncbi:MAG: helix-turn-helix transcriptional regulator [Pseudomonadales bacterium]|nr:helix-turn-helix transcriptional regulator [Pseudomonadales bacterium]